MSVLKELEGKQMKTTTQQTRGMQQISKVTNKFHLKTTDTSHRPQQFTSRMQWNKNTLTLKVEEGRQIRVEIETKCLWRRIYRVIHRLLIIHTKSTTFLVEMDKILLSFTPSFLCVPFSQSVLKAGRFWVEANSLMRTTTFWVGFLDCWRTCTLTGRSHPELAGTESIIGQGRPAMEPPRGLRKSDTFSSRLWEFTFYWLMAAPLEPHTWNIQGGVGTCEWTGFFLQVNSWMVSAREGGSVASLSEEWAGLTFPGGGMEWLVKYWKGLFLTLVTSQLVHHYLYRLQALMKALPEAKAEGKARLSAEPRFCEFSSGFNTKEQTNTKEPARTSQPAHSPGSLPRTSALAFWCVMDGCSPWRPSMGMSQVCRIFP